MCKFAQTLFWSLVVEALYIYIYILMVVDTTSKSELYTATSLFSRGQELPTVVNPKS